MSADTAHYYSGKRVFDLSGFFNGYAVLFKLYLGRRKKLL